MNPPEQPTLSEIKAEKEQSLWDKLPSRESAPYTQDIRPTLCVYASRQVSIDISIEFPVI